MCIPIAHPWKREFSFASRTKNRTKRPVFGGSARDWAHRGLLQRWWHAYCWLQTWVAKSAFKIPPQWFNKSIDCSYSKSPLAFEDRRWLIIDQDYPPIKRGPLWKIIMWLWQNSVHYIFRRAFRSEKHLSMFLVISVIEKCRPIVGLHIDVKVTEIPHKIRRKVGSTIQQVIVSGWPW